MELNDYEIPLDKIYNIQIWSTINKCKINTNGQKKIIDITFNNNTRLILEYEIFGFYDPLSFDIVIEIEKHLLNQLKLTDEFIDSIIIDTDNDEYATINIIGQYKDYEIKIYNKHNGNYPIDFKCIYNRCIYKFVL